MPTITVAGIFNRTRPFIAAPTTSRQNTDHTGMWSDPSVPRRARYGGAAQVLDVEVREFLVGDLVRTVLSFQASLPQNTDSGADRRREENVGGGDQQRLTVRLILPDCVSHPFRAARIEVGRRVVQNDGRDITQPSHREPDQERRLAPVKELRLEVEDAFGKPHAPKSILNSSTCGHAPGTR